MIKKKEHEFALIYLLCFSIIKLILIKIKAN